MDAGGDLGSAAKGSAIDLEVASSGPVSAIFALPSPFTMCSSLSCLSFVTMVHRPSSLVISYHQLVWEFQRRLWIEHAHTST